MLETTKNDKKTDEASPEGKENIKHAKLCEPQLKSN
jgi:hypothetical protein